MASSSRGPHGSHLQISVEPSQSSFFAGEEFHCTITFTNTRIPVPQTQPLPSRATFAPLNGTHQQRSVSSQPTPSTSLVSTSQHDAPSTSRSGRMAGVQGTSNGLPSPLSALPSSHRFHRKSQSVDIRTFARRHQLDGGAGNGRQDDDNEEGDGVETSDERYYRSLHQLDLEQDRLSQSQTDQVLQDLPERKRLIGKGVHVGMRTAFDTDPEQDGGSPSKVQLATPPAKRHTKAFSVSVAGTDGLPMQVGLGHPPLAPATFASPRIPSHRQNIDAVTASPSSSRTASAATSRKPSGPIAASHPHSRKKSVAQVQAEDLSATFELEGGDEGDNSMSRSPSRRSSSTLTTPRGSMDHRTERLAPSQGLYGLGENSTMESVLREDITQFSRMGLGARTASSNSMTLNGNGDASAQHGREDVETILWTFAQFGGHFQVDESLIKPGEFEHVKQRLAGIGGGSPMPMGDTFGTSIGVHGIGGGQLAESGESTGSTASSSTSEGWGSYLRNVLSSGSGTKRTSLGGMNHRRGGSTLLEARQKTMASRTIPVFSNPPSMVAIDLHLAPGRAISFNYTLTLGTNRLTYNARGQTQQKSRLVRIPMRIYNHVNISGVTAFYDLTNPIVNRTDQSTVREDDDEQEDGGRLTNDGSAKTTSASPFSAPDPNAWRKKQRASRSYAAADEALLRYARRLLNTCEGQAEHAGRDATLAGIDASSPVMPKPRLSPNTLRGNIALPPISRTARAPSLTRELSSHSSVGSHGGSDTTQAGLGLTVDEDDEPKSSHDAVELLSRNSQKVSYDISKDGRIAAILTLVKSKYRLGDTVAGVVSINEAQSLANVVRIAATLESHEEIESTLATVPTQRAQRLTRTIHASCHDATLDAGQACFSLPIPSGATPNFDTSAVRLVWTVRLAFLILSNVASREVTKEGEEVIHRSRPWPHLMAAPDDGFGAYHRSLRATPSLPGPWVGPPLSAEVHLENTNALPEAKLEIVECAVPLTVLPHSTRFTVGEVAFMV